MEMLANKEKLGQQPVVKVPQPAAIITVYGTRTDRLIPGIHTLISTATAIP